MRTVPLPTFSGEQITVSTSSKSSATAVPTISAMESAAPTSWKWTFSIGTWWTCASASPSLRKTAYGGALGGFGQIRAFDHLDDGGEMAVGLGFLYRDAVFGGADAGALHLFEGHDGAGIERSDGVCDGGLIGSGIGQCAHQHVAANSRECVQIASNRHELLL